MFTGIVEELGTVRSLSRHGMIRQLCIEADRVLDAAKTGDSIAVNGCCLTVTALERHAVSFDVMEETAQRTNLGRLCPGDRVNLERSLKVGDRLSGHFVSGHVDCLGTIRRKGQVRGNLSFEIALPQQYLKWVLPKGSVSVDGISLTVAEKKQSAVCVYLIPHTVQNTTLGFKGPSDQVNIECDILAKRATEVLC
ncbi:MAG: riboflavin synthase [Candidatus Omnitrophica bacterium]|nr:riboflavin synthase [Candidatus Omnitrophota bacterium]